MRRSLVWTIFGWLVLMFSHEFSCIGPAGIDGVLVF